MYEARDAAPWYQSGALDQELAQAQYGEMSDAEIAYRAELAGAAAGVAVLVWSVMHDGEIVTDLAHDFGGFVDAVLSFRRDPDVREVRWTVAPADPGADLADPSARMCPSMPGRPERQGAPR